MRFWLGGGCLRTVAHPLERGSFLSSKVRAVLSQGVARLWGSPPGVGKVIVTVSHTSP